MGILYDNQPSLSIFGVYAARGDKLSSVGVGLSSLNFTHLPLLWSPSSSVDLIVLSMLLSDSKSGERMRFGGQRLSELTVCSTGKGSWEEPCNGGVRLRSELKDTGK